MLNHATLVSIFMGLSRTLTTRARKVGVAPPELPSMEEAQTSARKPTFPPLLAAAAAAAVPNRP